MGSLAPNHSTGAQLPCSKVHWYPVIHSRRGTICKQLIMSKECSQGLTMTTLDPEGDTLTEISAHNILKYNKMVLLVYEFMVYFLFKALFSRLVPEKNGKREFSNIMLGRLKVKILYIVSCILYLCWPTGLFITSFFTLNLNMAHVSRVDCYLMGLVSLTILHS